MEEYRILLVEDNEDDVELVLKSLHTRNVKNKIDVVRDGEEALDYLFKKGKYKDWKTPPPQLVLLDLSLPKVNGLEVLKKMREKKKTRFIPVTIFTSSKEKNDIVTGYELGANSYIRKPVNFDKFKEAVENLGLYWLVLNEPLP